MVSRSSSAASVCPPPFRREDPAPDSILIGRFRGGPRTTPRATSGCRGGVERRGVGGSCEIGGRVRGRLDYASPPPSARSRLLASPGDVKLGAEHVRVADSGWRDSGDVCIRRFKLQSTSLKGLPGARAVGEGEGGHRKRPGRYGSTLSAAEARGQRKRHVGFKCKTHGVCKAWPTEGREGWTKRPGRAR